MLKNTSETYGIISKIFHWLSAALIILMLAMGYLITTSSAINLHKLLGLIILALVACRLLWTLMTSHPRLPKSTHLLEKVAARTVQACLYLCMFGMPLSGWAMTTAFGHPPTIAGIRLAMPGIATNPSLSALLWSVHQTLAIVFMTLIGLHILAALKHRFINKDSVLESMLP